MRLQSAGLLSGMCLMLVVLAGCSKDDTAEVYGVITVDGAPAEKGYISFFAVDGKAPTAGAAITEGGKYSAKAPLGNAKVVISISKPTGEKKKLYEKDPNSPVQEILAESLPAKYSDKAKSELTYETQPGRQEKNWDLKTK